MRIIIASAILCLSLFPPSLSMAADSTPPEVPENRPDWWSWAKTDVGLKLIKDEDGPMNLGAALTWDVKGNHAGTHWKWSADTSGRLQADASKNPTPLKAGTDMSATKRLDCFPRQDWLDPDISITAPVFDLGLRAAGESNQRFSESLVLAGVEARFENHMNSEGLLSVLPDVTASIDLAQRFASDERAKLGLSESDSFARWNVAAIWHSNLGYWTPGDLLDRFFVNYGVWHSQELSPDAAWKDAGLDRSTGWKVELETQVGDWIGARRGGVLTPGSIFVGYESGVIAPATTKNDTIYVYAMWDGRKLLSTK